ncbi:hypothetical protein [Flavobacterium sp. Root901]|nr:hypothetical protein [Flavobacterium sp. Root901]
MEQSIKKQFDKSVYNPHVFKTYKIIKKVTKYALYIYILYFAFEGFMNWK